MSVLSVLAKDQTDARQKVRAALVLGLKVEKAYPLGYWRVPLLRSPCFSPAPHRFRWNAEREVFEYQAEDKGEWVGKWLRAVPDDGFEPERNGVVIEFRMRKEASQ